ncbi:MAG: hypothetical protein PHR20_00040 [Bacteroidales bacterium]|nr:hypothetical protein [Bacteroidales bacterium]
MKKINFVFMLLVAVSFSAIAQDVQETTLSINKTDVRGFSVTVGTIDTKTVESAVIQKFEKEMALKSSKESGFKTFINQKVAAFGPDNYDVYAKVAQEGPKKAKKTVLQFAVTKGNLNAVTAESDPEVYVNIRNFLTEFSNYIISHDLSVKIAAQEAVVQKLIEEQNSMTTDKEKLQKQIEEVDKKISNKETEIKKAQGALDVLKKGN